MSVFGFGLISAGDNKKGCFLTKEKTQIFTFLSVQMGYISPVVISACHFILVEKKNAVIFYSL